MIIRSLLLGSAAALVAASSAQAADAIVVEPEPVEYVRVCDAYGTGFFFIPGTETCIRFSGFIRSVYEKNYLDTATAEYTITGAPAATTATLGAFGASVDSSATFWGQRARLNVDTRNETEWGTLRAIYRLEADGNEDTDIDMDVALISLAGFRAGFAGGNYWSTNHGYGGINAEGTGAVQGGISATDGMYGFNDATIFDYTFAAEGFSVTVGVEDGRIGWVGGRGGDFDGSNNSDTRAAFYAGFNYSGDWGGVAFTAVHDSQAQEITAAGIAADSGEWAYKASLNLDLSEWVPGGSLWGWYMDDGDAQTNYVHANGALQNPETVWGVAFGANLTDEVEFWVNYWDADGGFGAVDAAGTLGVEEGGADQFGVGINWYPSAAPGFHIKAAYVNGSIDGRVTQEVALVPAAAGNAGTAAAAATRTNTDYDGFEIVLRRDF